MPNDVQIITPDDERVKRGLNTIVGYGGTALAGVGFALSQTEAWHIPVPVQITLLIVSAVLAAVTGKGRSDQAAANRAATATVQAALMAPAPPPPAATTYEYRVEEAWPAPDGPADGGTS